MGVDSTLNPELVNMSPRGAVRTQRKVLPLEDLKMCMGGGFLNLQLAGRESRAGAGWSPLPCEAEWVALAMLMFSSAQ